ncbi:MAG: thermonuclease family protein, partial [Candidatus Omnitrophica bacterium]|nr:thermonuclease family protein [Candidatus Omnitrophota bacterium]
KPLVFLNSVRTMNYKTFLKSLNNLLNNIEDRSLDDEQRVHNLRMAWEVGRKVCEYKNESGYTIKQIAGDVGMSDRSLNKFVRAYGFFPDGFKEEIDKKPLTWSHYLAIVYIRSKEERDFYLKEAAANGWSSHQTRLRIRNNYYDNRVMESNRVLKGAKQKILKDRRQRLYTYGARVLKVVDGDTLLLQIDVGFKTVMEHKVRLRGINCAERKSKLGDKAKEFVVQRLMGPQGADGQVVVSSYKTGKFGRYIADVWYMPQESDKERVVQEGRYLNQELLDEELAVMVE